MLFDRDGSGFLGMAPCCPVALNPNLVAKVGAVDYPREILYKNRLSSYQWFMKSISASIHQAHYLVKIPKARNYQASWYSQPMKVHLQDHAQLALPAPRAPRCGTSTSCMLHTYRWCHCRFSYNSDWKQSKRWFSVIFFDWGPEFNLVNDSRFPDCFSLTCLTYVNCQVVIR